MAPHANLELKEAKKLPMLYSKLHILEAYDNTKGLLKTLPL